MEVDDEERQKQSAGEREVEEERENERKKSVVIKIPSYQEVFETSQAKPPPSLFRPSSSFAEAFSFIKNSEFYSTPPPPPPTSSSQSVPSQVNSASRPSEASCSSSSASASVSSSAPSLSVQNRNAILVSHRQKGNPLLKHIRNVRWMFADVVCDYLLGQNSCALYLSLRYHLLHPDYLYYRIRELNKNFKLCVVLCHVDIEDVVKPLLEVTRTALLHDCTLLCGWSLEECGRYLETIKVYENKPADIIQGQMDTDYMSRLTHALTTVRHINKTDVVTLGSAFGSLSRIMDASMEELARCPGIGERKVRRLYEAFHEPFKRVLSSQPVDVPEALAQEDAAPCPVENEMQDKEAVGVTKRKKREPSLTVKTALTAAFAKYSYKVRGRKDKSQTENGEETNASLEAKAEKTSNERT